LSICIKKIKGAEREKLRPILYLHRLMSAPEEANPWQVKGTEVKMDTPWVKVSLYDVINPSGQPGIYGVTHFKHLAIGILPLDDELCTWLVGQYRFPIQQYSWEIPEGGGDLNVPPLVSAKRELKEETGIEADEWTLIQHLHTSNSATDEYACIYLARKLRFGKSAPEPDEQLQVKKIHFEELYRLVAEGKITDSLTVAAVFKVKMMLVEGFLQ
jgi:8-oxo-dGTP pyrophosphatase MutT (NUDIX family)